MSDVNGASLDSALEVLRFERESAAAVARLSSEQLGDMRDEAESLAEVDVVVSG